MSDVSLLHDPSFRVGEPVRSRVRASGRLLAKSRWEGLRQRRRYGVARCSAEESKGRGSGQVASSRMKCAFRMDEREIWHD
jgi:hypothetical protein